MDKQQVTNYGLGLAAGVIVTWALGFLVSIPGEVGSAIGTICVWAAWKLNLGND